MTRTPLALLLAGLLLATSACSDKDDATENAAADRMDDAAAEAAREQANEARDDANAAPEDQSMGQALPPPENVDAPPADAKKTANGVAYIVLQDAPGSESPTVSDTVTVHYTGWTTDGQMFDSSVVRGEPATYPLNALIPGWQEAIPVMTVGDKYRFWIPGNLAYDNSSRPGAPKGMLVFDIELLGIQQQDQPADTKPDGN